MPTHSSVNNLLSDKQFQQVLAGKITVQDYFTKPKFEHSKSAFMEVYRNVIGTRPENSLYSNEQVAASWITKLRFNQDMTDEQFTQLTNRSEAIFKGEVDNLNLKAATPEENDLCTIMWGIEALNGIQSFDSGATRVRLAEGVAPKIVKALENGGSVPRASTHATCTKLIDKGLGKDLEDEKLRKFTPRGMGALLVIPTSQDGKGGIAKATNKISSQIQSPDYDLLLKREDYGYNDTIIHNRVHSHIGFINHLTEHRQQYKEGMPLINKKSDLAKNAEQECGKGTKIHRKEHLSELKQQSATLVNLLEAGHKSGLFQDFKTTWTIRIKWPPWEKKIVSSDPNNRQGLGDFLLQLAQATDNNAAFAAKNATSLKKVSGLLQQAKDQQFGAFQLSREGNEVLVNCKNGNSILVDNIAKKTKNDPVNREELAKLGMVSEVNPEHALQAQQHLHGEFRDLRKQEQTPSPNIAVDDKNDEDKHNELG